MSASYRAVSWNRQKRLYDLALGGILAAGIGAFAVATIATKPGTTAETLVIRATAVAALALLHVILCIGPLCRLNPLFLPIHYNRRHLGVTMFLLALVHAAFAVFQFQGFGDANPIVGALTAYAVDYVSGVGIAHFPFEIFGAVALAILFLMAATSHDFWLKNLGASFWKSMHMLVYAAYGCVLVHVFFGTLQSERSLAYPVVLGVGFAIVVALHLAAWRRERRADRQVPADADDGFVDACAVADVRESFGKAVWVGTERVAVFRRDGRIFGLSNVCRHQGGPVGEGRIVDGCATCPWHGWNYKVDDGCSPPPFKEVLPTYRVRVRDGRVLVHPAQNAPGTVCEGAPCDAATERGDEPFYVGYLAKLPAPHAHLARRFAIALVLAVPAILGLVALAQQPVDEGTFEYGVVRTFEGVLSVDPVPVLRGADPETGEPTTFVLCGAFKFALPAEARVHDGKRIRFDGTLIRRGDRRMVEMNAPETIRVVGDAAEAERPSAFESLGTMTLRGEIVDTKCFLGVMRPAVGKVHRGCAIRCLSGGIPPGFRVVDADGRETVLLLAGAPGKALELDVQLAGVPVEIVGDVETQDDFAILRVRSVRRVR